MLILQEVFVSSVQWHAAQEFGEEGEHDRLARPPVALVVVPYYVIHREGRPGARHKLVAMAQVTDAEYF
ncbi:MAG: hypothetical protein K2H76_06625 [Muribaculaceae bacterium]|nr:hypothetical protein [Muribaculaceae bacterium]